ncbi:hypothetical protein Tco_0822267 [Tanacetum coccineum]|uniref:Tf2-1-like SH3-like domain-containing protein n=1 Tax=Tanacetum coccineum TaxID=301880 RepID=A0ABQ5AIW1_9ASTR
MVMLKVSPWKGVIRFGKHGKLSPRYIGPFKIIERISPMAYKLELPDKLRGIHSTFHVLNLKKCLADENLVIPLEEIQLDNKLHFIEEPVEIMDHEVKQLKQSRIPIVKVRWNSRRVQILGKMRRFLQKKLPSSFLELSWQTYLLLIMLRIFPKTIRKSNLSSRQPDHLNKFAPHQIPQPEGFMNGWILEDDEEKEEEEDPEMEE